MRCAVENDTTSSRDMAEIQFISTRTVDTYWVRTTELLEVKGRWRAVRVVQESGWLDSCLEK